MQIGAHASGPGDAWSVRGRIFQPSEFVNGTFGRTYWIYATFPDDTFFQAGVLDASSEYTDLCQTGFSTFVTALDPDGHSLFSSLYNNGHCNLTGAHYFILEVVDANPPYSYTWQWSMGDSALGPRLRLPYTAGHFHRIDAGAVTEIVKTGPPPNTALPTVRYDPAIQFITPQ